MNIEQEIQFLKEHPPMQVGKFTICLDLLEEPEHFIHEWNRFTDYLKSAQFMLEEGDISQEERARYEKATQNAQRVLEMIKERCPEIEQLVQVYEEGFEAVRAETFQELNRTRT